MNIGKIITILIAIGVCALMVMMLMFQTPSKKGGEAKAQSASQNNDTQVSNQAQSTTIENFASSEELQKIKELAGSVQNKAAEGTSKLYLTSCAPCHGADGRGVMAPNIAGMDKEQLIKKLQDYKAGKVENSLMKGLLTNTSDADIALLADEISKFKK